jgi:hypothetical protein
VAVLGEPTGLGRFEELLEEPLLLEIVDELERRDFRLRFDDAISLALERGERR